MIRWIKQLICKHNYREYTKKEPYFNLSGDTIYIICDKCGKSNGSYLRPH